MYGERISKKSSWTIGFSSFLDFDKKTLCFCRNVFGRVVKTTFDVSSGTLTEQHFRMKVLKTRGFSDNFWSFRDNGGKTFSGLAKQQKMSAGTLYEFFFQKRKFAILSDSERLFTSSENFCQSCETRNLRLSGSFRGKTFFEIYIIFHTSLDFVPQNA